MSDAAEQLSERRLNRALLARQHLLERADVPIDRVLEDVGGLQTQYSPSGYVGLWTRLAGFRRDSLTDALNSRDVIQATLMRTTIHMVSAADYWPITAGVRNARRAWHARASASVIGGASSEGLSRVLRQVLSHGPLRWSALASALAEHGFADASSGTVSVWADLVRVPPSGTWEHRRADVYGLADQWLPAARAATEGEGIELLVRRYLGAFGPARPSDIAAWAGLPVTSLRPAIQSVAARHFVDESGRKLIDLTDAALPSENTPAPVRFLPTWDATLLAHARRTQIVPERFRPLIFSTKTPHSIGTFLVDGQVAGTWRYESGRVQWNTLEPLSKSNLSAIDAEAEQLSAFHR